MNEAQMSRIDLRVYFFLSWFQVSFFSCTLCKLQMRRRLHDRGWKKQITEHLFLLLYFVCEFVTLKRAESSHSDSKRFLCEGDSRSMVSISFSRLHDCALTFVEIALRCLCIMCLQRELRAASTEMEQRRNFEANAQCGDDDIKKQRSLFLSRQPTTMTMTMTVPHT